MTSDDGTKILRTRIHDETGYTITDCIDANGEEYSFVTDNEGEECELGEFYRKLSWVL